jgi:RNA polymerase sigma factor (sigma-70 family)
MTTATEIRIEDHVRLVHHYLRRRGCARWLVSATLSYDDLLQVGLQGLVRARETWDPAKGAWSTHASWFIRAYVGREIATRDSTIHIPVHVQEKRHKLGAVQRRRLRSLDAPARSPSDDGTGDALGDRIASDAPSPDAQLEADDRAKLLEKIMAAAELSRAEKIVIRERFLSGREPTLDAVRPRVGHVSRERVRQLEASGLRKLQDAAQRLGVGADAA